MFDFLNGEWSIHFSKENMNPFDHKSFILILCNDEHTKNFRSSKVSEQHN